MKELIIWWRMFIEDWDKEFLRFQPTATESLSGIAGMNYQRPNFYDFMEWISKHYK